MEPHTHQKDESVPDGVSDGQNGKEKKHSIKNINMSKFDDYTPVFEGSELDPKESWAKINELVEKYDAQRCDSWEKDIQNLWVFAGLFSATVTALAVESYKLLQTDTDDATVQLLSRISSQLEGLRVGNNSSGNILPLPDLAAGPSRSAVRINVLWFLSLVLSLGTVVIGILGIQWLREYRKINPSLPQKDIITHRYLQSEGFRKWHVPTILSWLPVLVQWAIILFFAGLVDFLWQLNTTVAITVTILVAAVLIILALTTIIPVLQVLLFIPDPNSTQCPYKSPQSMTFGLLGKFVSWAMQGFIDDWFDLPFDKWRSWANLHLRVFSQSNWTVYDIYWTNLREEVVRKKEKGTRLPLDDAQALTWLGTSLFIPTPDLSRTITNCLWSVLEDTGYYHNTSNLIAEMRLLHEMLSFLEKNQYLRPLQSTYCMEAFVGICYKMIQGTTEYNLIGDRYWRGEDDVKNEDTHLLLNILQFLRVIDYSKLQDSLVSQFISICYSVVTMSTFHYEYVERIAWSMRHLLKLSIKRNNKQIGEQIESLHMEILDWAMSAPPHDRLGRISRSMAFAMGLPSSYWFQNHITEEELKHGNAYIFVQSLVHLYTELNKVFINLHEEDKQALRTPEFREWWTYRLEGAQEVYQRITSTNASLLPGNVQDTPSSRQGIWERSLQIGKDTTRRVSRTTSLMVPGRRQSTATKADVETGPFPDLSGLVHKGNSTILAPTVPLQEPETIAESIYSNDISEGARQNLSLCSIAEIAEPYNEKRSGRAVRQARTSKDLVLDPRSHVGDTPGAENSTISRKDAPAYQDPGSAIGGSNLSVGEGMGPREDGSTNGSQNREGEKALGHSLVATQVGTVDNSPGNPSASHNDDADRTQDFQEAIDCTDTRAASSDHLPRNQQPLDSDNAGDNTQYGASNSVSQIIESQGNENAQKDLEDTTNDRIESATTPVNHPEEHSDLPERNIFLTLARTIESGDPSSMGDRTGRGPNDI